MWGEEVGTKTNAILEFLGSGNSEPKNSSRGQKSLKQSRLVSLCGVEWLAHQLLREVANQSVEIGEAIIAAKVMPEWEKAVEEDEKESWEALEGFDKQDKLEADKMRKNKNKYKNKTKNLSEENLESKIKVKVNKR